MSIRIAIGLACSKMPEHRWRRVAVPISAAVFMVLVLASSSVVLMVHRESERVMQRTALLAEEPSPSDVDLITGDDMVGGKQFLVVHIEPAGSKEPVLPPGMSKMPEPGQSVVSPALDRLAASDPDVAQRYPNRSVLGLQGLQSESELLAYIRVPEGRDMPGDLVKDLSGETQSVRVQAFGKPSSTDSVYDLDPLLSPPSVGEAMAGVIGFLVAPGLMVLTVGFATASNVRDRRFEVLHWIGAPTLTLAALAVLETMVLALPGLIAAVILWAAASPLLGRVPWVGHDVLRGDLGLPWWLLGMCLVAGLITTAVVAIAVTAVRRRIGAQPRPTYQRVDITPLRAAPLGVALAAFMIGWPVRGPVGGMLNIGAIIATMIGVPLVFPGVLRAVGRALGRLGSVSIQIAGRGLEWYPTRTARPFLGVATLLVIVLASSGYVALARNIETAVQSTWGTEGVQGVFVEWLDPRPDDLTRLASDLGTALVVPFDESSHEHGHAHDKSHEQAMILGSTCSNLANYFSGASCQPGSPYELSEGMEQELSEILSIVTHASNQEVQLGPAEEVATSGSALVISNSSLRNLEDRTRTAAMRELPAPYIYSKFQDDMQTSPLVAWIAGGIAVAAFALAIACFVSLVDRLLGIRDHRRQLLKLGISTGQLAKIDAWQFAAPYSVVVLLGFSAGLAVCAMMIAPDIPIPWSDIGLTAGVAVFVGMVGTVSVTLFGVRMAQTGSE